LGVSVSALEHTDEAQLELFPSNERTKALQDALDQVRDKLGEASVVPAGSLAYRRAMGHVAFGAVRGASPPDKTDGPRSEPVPSPGAIRVVMRRPDPSLQTHADQTARTT
jgi:hypothetical protein